MRLGYCELIFKYREGNDKWIIGSNFFDNYVTVFNYDNQKKFCFIQQQNLKYLNAIAYKK